ncbi:hypothetical protein [Ectothiorhodospira variabilis]|uniref:hypothetical protein n=1 Tax=Ectothiorhodospira variabilis TaxID=505694 RepID=UPI001EFB68EA|nr:hypothetical protein [Ectothiorhodospira variabilis]MCG5495605.1 hypothetical protein [Ectothiorhodospira variabilis]MCG5503073.1 hypothetical protein [Ectothiorhodospira variabilis]MCG5506168.1 hypothetical protein [Ectothiorhodospira variabilis]
MAAGLLLAAGLASAQELSQGRYQVLELEGELEWASGPSELISMESREQVTLRALRAFGRLPEEFSRLALDLRGQGVDLFSAGPAEVRELLERARSGDLRADPATLEALLVLLEDRDYLDWEPLRPGEALTLTDETRFRGEGQLVLEDASGERQRVATRDDARHGLRVMPADEHGLQPEEGPALPERVAQWWADWNQRLEALQGPLQVDAPQQLVPLGDGRFQTSLTSVAVMAPWPTVGMSTSWVPLDDLTVTVGPFADERIPFHVSLPSEVSVLTEDGERLARVDFTAPRLEGVWADDLGVMLETRFTMGPSSMTVGYGRSPDAPVDHPQDHGQRFDPESPRRIALDAMDMTLNLQDTGAGIFSGPLTMEIKGLDVLSMADQAMVKLGRLAFNADYQGMDLATLAKLSDQAAAPEQLMAQDPADLLASTLKAMGGFESTMEVSDLFINGPEDYQFFRLSQGRARTGFVPSEQGELHRDLWAGVGVEGWSFGDGDRREQVRFEMKSASMEGRLNGLSSMALLHLGMQSMMTGQLEDEVLLGMAREILGGVSVNMSLDDARGVLVDGRNGAREEAGVDRFHLNLALEELDGPAPHLSVDYAHAGVVPFDGLVPPEMESLMPEGVALELKAQGLPTGFLTDAGVVEGLQTGRLDPMVVLLEQLIGNDSRLDIPNVTLGFPEGQILVSGRGWAEKADEAGPDRVSGEWDLSIHNLDALVKPLLAMAGEDERRQINATVVMLKMLAETPESEGPHTVHQYHVQADSLGQILINGNDLAPLLDGLNR